MQTTDNRPAGQQTRGRRGARRLLAQALYQYQIAGNSPAELRAQFSADSAFDAIDSEYFLLLLDEVLADTDSLDQQLTAAADRDAGLFDPLERGVLWIGLTELKSHDDVPTRVVINEAVELAKGFGAEGGHRFVNGVLDRLAVQLR